MLHEIKRPKSLSSNTRWFMDEQLDLCVWYSDDEITGFQLSYDKQNRERAFTWKNDGTRLHTVIDTGEDSPNKNMSPILVRGGVSDADAVLPDFLERAKGIDSEITDFVASKLAL